MRRPLITASLFVVCNIFGTGIAMAQSGLDVVRAYYAAYGTGDMNRVAEFFTDDIVWHIPGHHPLAGTKRGKAEVLAFFRELGRGQFRAEVISLTGDDRTVVDIHRGWSNIPNAVNVDTIWALQFTIEGGKIKEARNFSFDQHAADAFFTANYSLRPLPDRLARPAQ